LFGRDNQKLNEVKVIIESLGTNALIFSGDVAEINSLILKLPPRATICEIEIVLQIQINVALVLLIFNILLSKYRINNVVFSRPLKSYLLKFKIISSNIMMD
jgi:hypothetical protein